jgi:hypothetical protein
LDLGYYQLAEGVDIFGLCSHDGVVRARYRVGRSDSVDGGDFPDYRVGFADLGLNEDVCLNHT